MQKLCELLKAKRIRDGLTQDALAEQLGITSNYLSRIERGAVTPGSKSEGAIRRYLDDAPSIHPLDLAEISEVVLPGDEQGMVVARRPGDVAAGDGIDVDTRLPDEVAIPSCVLPRATIPFWAVRVKGDSMAPEFADGDYVAYGDPHTLGYHAGSLVVVHLDGAGFVMKRWRRSAGVCTLTPQNPDHKPIVAPAAACEVVGVVRAHYSKGARKWRATR